MAKPKTISAVAEEIVNSGRRFGNAWATLRDIYRKKGKERDKWCDTMVIKLDSPTSEGFHKILRKMVRTLYSEEGTLKWNISGKILDLLGDKSRAYWRQAFMTGVYFGYFGHYEKQGGPDDQKNIKEPMDRSH